MAYRINYAVLVSASSRSVARSSTLYKYSPVLSIPYDRQTRFFLAKYLQVAEITSLFSPLVAVVVATRPSGEGNDITKHRAKNYYISIQIHTNFFNIASLMASDTDITSASIGKVDTTLITNAQNDDGLY